MATDGIYTRFYNKKIAPIQHFKDYFLDYLLLTVREELELQFRTDGVFDAQVVVEPESGGADNQVDIARTSGFTATDGEGRIMKMDAADSRMQDINIPPGAGVLYHVGLEQEDVVDGVEINPRTGEPEYSTYKELPGRVGTPDSVSYGGGNLTITVNSITGASESHAGRKVRVWLKPRADGGPGPLAATAGSAIQELTIVYSSPNNTVVTSDTFGQGVSPSTTASDYEIQIVGPTVRKESTEDLSSTAGCFFLAAVTSVASGNPIPGGNISMAAQNVLAFSESDLSQVVRRDAHDDVKIRVTADALDDDEPQIDVLASDLVTTVFSVDEDGDIRGVGQTAGQAVGWSSADDPTLDTFVDTNILGAINEHSKLFTGSNVPGILSLLTATFEEGTHSGLDFMVGDATDPESVWFANGKRWVYTPEDTVTLSDNTVNVVYLDASDGDLKKVTYEGVGFEPNKLPLYVVTTASGAITDVKDVRRRWRPHQHKGSIVVGPDGDFTSLQAAIDWWYWMAGNPQSESGGEQNPYEIIIQGYVGITSTINLNDDHRGLTIRGVGTGINGSGSEQHIHVTAGVPLFTIQGIDYADMKGIRLINLNVALDHADSQFIYMSDSNPVHNVSVQGCYVYGVTRNTYIECVEVQHLLVENCFFNNNVSGMSYRSGAGAGESFITLATGWTDRDNAADVTRDNIIRNNTFHVRHEDFYSVVIRGHQNVIQGNIFRSFWDEGGAETTGAGGAIAIYLDGDSTADNNCWNNVIQGNTFSECRDAAIYFHGGQSCFIADNMFIDVGDANYYEAVDESACIFLDGSVHPCIGHSIQNNYLQPDGPNVADGSFGIRLKTCTDCRISGNAIIHKNNQANVGIYTEGTCDSIDISFNTIDMSLGASEAGGNTGSACIAVDNQVSPATRMFIVGNTCANCGSATLQGWGIVQYYSTSGNDWWTVVANMFRNIRGTAANINGERCIVALNSVPGGYSSTGNLSVQSGRSNNLLIGNQMEYGDLSHGSAASPNYGLWNLPDLAMSGLTSGITGVFRNCRVDHNPASQSYTGGGAVTTLVSNVGYDGATPWQCHTPLRWTLPPAISVSGGQVNPGLRIYFSDDTYTDIYNTNTGASLTQGRGDVFLGNDKASIDRITIMAQNTGTTTSVDLGAYVYEGLISL